MLSSVLLKNTILHLYRSSKVSVRTMSFSLSSSAPLEQKRSLRWSLTSAAASQHGGGCDGVWRLFLKDDNLMALLLEAPQAPLVSVTFHLFSLHISSYSWALGQTIPKAGGFLEFTEAPLLSVYFWILYLGTLRFKLSSTRADFSSTQGSWGRRLFYLAFVV